MYPALHPGSCAPMRQLIDNLGIHKAGIFVFITTRLQLVSSLRCHSTCDRWR